MRSGRNSPSPPGCGNAASRSTSSIAADTPAVYRFLDPDGTLIQQYDPRVHDAVLASADVIVLVDANHPDRTRTNAGRDSRGVRQ